MIGYTLSHRRPLIPADADHLGSLEPARCLDCHGPAGRRPRGRNHPLNDQCFNCHERA
ncbi:MAG TPA: cytochrome c3 family protein [Candidatus Polarisedimenticolia bacterium]|nr:cytochrome c3 family protein [Candidatus Polarisedimenticolia bacterium]